MVCSNCGTENPGAAKFCMSCGHTLENSCPACSTALPDGARFCFNCGHELTAGATAGMSGQSTQQVAQQLAEDIRRQPSSGGERRTITLMFCDVTGSTAAAEQLDPEAWAQVMRGAFDRFFAPVERYGGTVARLLGDAILAYFGAPIAHEDDPERAVLAGLDIIESMKPYADEVKAKHGIEFGVRVGINTGLVVVGDLGTDSYSEYTALGDAANVAARMEQTAEPGTVRIAPATHKLVAPLFDIEDAGELAVKGKSEPMRAYRVLAAKAERGRLRGIEGLSAPLIGRDEEREKLEDAVKALQAGRGGIATLIGEAGLGKSRLASELKHFVAATGAVHWHEGKALSYDTETPFAPFVDLLNDMCDIRSEQNVELRRQAVQAHAAALIGERAPEATTYLSSLLGIPPTQDEQETLRHIEPPLLRQRMFDSVVEMVTAAANTTPLVLVLDDLHWADSTSLELLETLMPVTNRVPLLILGLLRPQRQDPAWKVHETAARDYPHRYTSLHLRPLNEEQSADLVRSLLEIDGIPMSMRRLILAKSEGNPFYVEEVIRTLLDSGVVVREGERWVATAEVADVAVPDSLVAVVQTRLDSLDPEVRKVLQAGSVVGRDFGVDILTELTDLGSDVQSALDVLLRRELIVETQGDAERSFAFRHAITRDVAYTTLLQSTRRDFHRLAGKWLEERHPDRVNDLARHFLEADEATRALPYVVAAGDRSFHAFSMPEAIRYYRSALEIFNEGDDIELAKRAYEGLGGSLAFSGDADAALDTYREMIELGERAGHGPTRVSGMNKMAMTQALFLGRMEEAEQNLLNAKSVAEAANDLPGLAEFHMVYCNVNTLGGHLDVAESHLAEAAELGTVMQSSKARCFGLTHYANTLVFLTRFEEAARVAEEAEQLAIDADERQFLAELYGETYPLLEIMDANLEAAREHTLQGAKIAREIGATFALGIALYLGAKVDALLGRYETARSQYEEAASIGEMTGFVGLIGAASAGLAGLRQNILGIGLPDLRDLVEKGREPLDHPLGILMAGFALSELADVAIREGWMELATAMLVEGMNAKSTTGHLAAPDFMLCSAHLARDQGDLAKALSLIEDAGEYVAARNMHILEPKLSLARALTSRPDESMKLFEQAAAQAGAQGQIPLVARIQKSAAGVAEAAGLEVERKMWREAHADTVADMADLMEDRELRRAFLKANTI